jgi:hypothetical protein
MADDPPKPKADLPGKDEVSPEIAKLLADGDAAIRRAEEALKRFEIVEAARKAKSSKEKSQATTSRYDRVNDA